MGFNSPNYGYRIKAKCILLDIHVTFYLLKLFNKRLMDQLI